MTAGERGDNTARCDDATVWGPLCAGCGSMTPPHRHGAGWVAPRPVPAADRQTDEERCYPECHYLGCEPDDDCPPARPAAADAVMADLRDELEEGVTVARLREAIADGIPEWAGLVPEEQGWLADAVLALPEMRALLDAAAKVQRVKAAHDWQCDCTADDPCRIRIEFNEEEPTQ